MFKTLFWSNLLLYPLKGIQPTLIRLLNKLMKVI